MDLDSLWAKALVLPLPMSVNSLYQWGRRGHVYKHPDAVRWTQAARVKARAWRRQTGWTPTHQQKVVAWVRTFWPDEARRDTHNLYKVLWDALEGVLYDDDYWVLVRQADFAIDPQDPRIEISFQLYGIQEDDAHD